MAIRNRLNHIAAGLLGSFCSRCNSLEGYWALGMLYQEVQETPYRVTLDLLSRTATPAGHNADQITRRYAGYLEHALLRHRLRLEDLAEATVRIQFKADVPQSAFQSHWIGDPFTCTVTLRRSKDRASYTASGKCMPNDPRLFSQGGQRIAWPQPSGPRPQNLSIDKKV